MSDNDEQTTKASMSCVCGFTYKNMICLQKLDCCWCHEKLYLHLEIHITFFSLHTYYVEICLVEWNQTVRYGRCKFMSVRTFDIYLTLQTRMVFTLQMHLSCKTSVKARLLSREDYCEDLSCVCHVWATRLLRLRSTVSCRLFVEQTSEASNDRHVYPSLSQEWNACFMRLLISFPPKRDVVFISHVLGSPASLSFFSDLAFSFFLPFIPFVHRNHQNKNDIIYSQDSMKKEKASVRLRMTCQTDCILFIFVASHVGNLF